MFKKISKDEVGKLKTAGLDVQMFFSIDSYQDDKRIDFGQLRVFDVAYMKKSYVNWHPHRDYQIFTYVFDGEIIHEDNYQNKIKLKSPALQLIQAGKGISHCETIQENSYCNLIQFWFYTCEYNLDPLYQHANLIIEKNKLNLIISPVTKENTIQVKNNIYVYIGQYTKTEEFMYPVGSRKKIFIYVIKGNLLINNLLIKDKDALEITNELLLEIKTEKNLHFMLIDMIE